MKKRLPLIILAALLVLLIKPLAFAEVVEKIYAVVNGELITFSELKNTEMEMTRILSQQFKDDELTKELETMKSELLDRLIEQKLVLSYAKEQNFDVEGDLELIIKNLKQQNNLKTDDELKQAMASQGIDFNDWKKNIRDSRIQARYIYQEIGNKIKIDNSAIMEHYKKNIKEYTNPAQMTLQCIYLDRPNYSEPDALKAKQDAILAELNAGSFEEVAKKNSELPMGENNYTLGEFKKGELDGKIEALAESMKEGDVSHQWVETDSGWYIIKLVKYIAPKLVEYKNVRTDIENKLRDAEQEIRLKDYLKKLKAESHIKIYAR